MVKMCVSGRSDSTKSELNLHSLLRMTQGQYGWPWTEENPQLPDTMPDGKHWPKISIVTPSYNQGQFLEETIRSVLLQGYPNLEYIIMDGGSADNSVEIIKRYENRLTCWVSEKDRGQTDALNKGFRRATGEIFGFLNSDDFLLPGALRRVAYHMERLRVSWIAGACRYMNKSEGTSSAWTPRELNSIPHWLAGEAGLPQRSTFWKRQIWQEVGGFREDMHYAFDDEYWIRLLSRGFEYRVVKDELAAARLHRDCKTLSNPEAFVIEREKIRDLYLPKLSKSDLRKFTSLMRNRAIQEECAHCLAILADKGRWAAFLAATRMLRKHHVHSFRRCYFGMLRRVMVTR